MSSAKKRTVLNPIITTSARVPDPIDQVVTAQAEPQARTPIYAPDEIGVILTPEATPCPTVICPSTSSEPRSDTVNDTPMEPRSYTVTEVNRIMNPIISCPATSPCQSLVDPRDVGFRRRDETPMEPRSYSITEIGSIMNPSDGIGRYGRQGPQGSIGPRGYQGPAGGGGSGTVTTTDGFTFKCFTSNVDPVAAGYLGINPTFSLNSRVIMSAVCDSSADVSAWIELFGLSTGPSFKGQIKITKADSHTDFVVFKVTGAPGSIGGSPSCYQVPVEYVTGSGTFSYNDQLAVAFVATGNLGATGSTGLRGFQGAQGKVGNQGYTGVQGNQGPMGMYEVGNQGHAIVSNPIASTTNVIVPQAGNVKGLTLKPAVAGQTSSLLEAHDSSGNAVTLVQSGGTLSLNPNLLSLAALNLGVLNSDPTSPNSGDLWIVKSGDSLLLKVMWQATVFCVELST